MHLGVEEWRKVYPEHEKLRKKAVLVVMADDTKNCDDVAEYLESTYPEFKDIALLLSWAKGLVVMATPGNELPRLRATKRPQALAGNATRDWGMQLVGLPV